MSTREKATGAPETSTLTLFLPESSPAVGGAGKTWASWEAFLILSSGKFSFVMLHQAACKHVTASRN